MDTAAEWIAVRVDVSDVAADAIGALLLEHGATSLLLGESDDPDPGPLGTSRVEAHFPPAMAATVTAALTDHLPRLRAIFPELWLATRVTPLPAVDWNATFRQHHRPILVGRRLLIAPPWDVPEDPAREVLIIEPGMAFGTGQHATTRGCLEEIEAAIETGAVRSALDVGTGSGLLAAALARLGVPTVVAIDNDPAVLDLARTNLRHNGVGRVHVVGGTVAAVRGVYDLVVANLLLDVIVEGAANLAPRVATHGRLILSGLLATQVDTAVAAFPSWRPTAIREEIPWATVRMERGI